MNRAVILAGGRGTRLRPYTVSLPKPLMPIVDHPILEIIIRQLARAGFEHVTLTVNYQAEIFRAYFGDGSKWRIRIDYSLETQPLSTMGPLRLIPDLPNDFLVMNGDVLTDLDFRAFLSEHTQGRRLFSISAAAREQRIDYRARRTRRSAFGIPGKADYRLSRQHGYLRPQPSRARFSHDTPAVQRLRPWTKRPVSVATHRCSGSRSQLSGNRRQGSGAETGLYLRQRCDRCHSRIAGNDAWLSVQHRKGTSHSVADAIRTVCRIAGVTKPYRAIVAATRPNEIDDDDADISALRAETGWTPRVSFDEGLRKLVEKLRIQ
jgi:hypothetical protein